MQWHDTGIKPWFWVRDWGTCSKFKVETVIFEKLTFLV